MNERVISPTWHVAQGSIEQQQDQPSEAANDRIPISFGEAETELNLIYFVRSLSASSEQPKRYHIFTSTSTLFFKLFVSEKV